MIGYKQPVFSNHLTISGKPTTKKCYKELEMQLTENVLYISIDYISTRDWKLELVE